MNQLLHYFILLPFVGMLLSAIPHKNRETLIFWLVTATLLLQGVGLLALSITWLLEGADPLFEKFLVYYERGDAEFSFDLYFDRLSMVYGFMAVFLATMIALFSRYYMHRDPGYKRFYNNMMFFFAGVNLVVFSGNFETLFLGWEVLGISSFMLIGFYRERYLPVKNAMKVVSLFRLSDLLLLIAMWLGHEAFERNIVFPELQEPAALLEQMASNPWNYYLIPILLLVVAAIKSGQFPFSSWLPRAMEGPTVSSAIFYGSLSVHIGLFLMIRVMPLWIENLPVRLLIMGMGVLTALVSTSIANVQPTVKAQIAYSSIAQIGIMFVEIALGWDLLAMIHFVGNALLRSYQLLVSPSVLNYLIHDQYFNFQKPVDKVSDGFMGRLRSTLFILSIKEYNLDRFQFHMLWSPFKFIGRRLTFFRKNGGYALVGLAVVLGIVGLVSGGYEVLVWHKVVAFVLLVIAFLLVLTAFGERDSAKRAWLFVLMAHLLINLAISYNAGFDAFAALIYLSGVVVAGMIGFVVLHRVEKEENTFDLGHHYGHIYEHPRFGMVFLFSALAVVGFPITPTFIGLDVVLSKIHANQVPFLVFTGLSFIFMEITVLRIYTRVFLGQHVKAYHARAFRNS